MNNIDAALSMVGLATKAGRTVNGSEMCENAIKKQKVFLLLTATDASPKTIEPLLKLCKHHSVPVRNVADREMLGRFSGKDNRAAVAVIDKGFAARIIEILDGTKAADQKLPAEKRTSEKRASDKGTGVTETSVKRTSEKKARAPVKRAPAKRAPAKREPLERAPAKREPGNIGTRDDTRNR